MPATIAAVALTGLLLATEGRSLAARALTLRPVSLHRQDFLFSLFVALADYCPWPDRAGNSVALFGRVRGCHGDCRSHFFSLGRKTPAIQDLDNSQGT